MCLLARERGKISNRAVSPRTFCYHPCPGPEPDQGSALLPPLQPPSGRHGASLVEKWASDELVPFLARGTCRVGVEEPERHSDLSHGVQLCLRVPEEVHHAGQRV